MSLAPFYPIDRYFDIALTRRVTEQQFLPGMPPKDISHWVKLVRILDGVESALPFVALSYFHKEIILSCLIGGQTDDDRWAYIESAREAEVVSIEQIDNPARPGHQIRVIKLKVITPLSKRFWLENDLGC